MKTRTSVLTGGGGGETVRLSVGGGEIISLQFIGGGGEMNLGLDDLSDVQDGPLKCPRTTDAGSEQIAAKCSGEDT